MHLWMTALVELLFLSKMIDSQWYFGKLRQVEAFQSRIHLRCSLFQTAVFNFCMCVTTVGENLFIISIL